MKNYNFQVRKNSNSQIIGGFVATNSYGVFIYYEQIKKGLSLWIKLEQWQEF